MKLLRFSLILICFLVASCNQRQKPKPKSIFSTDTNIMIIKSDSMLIDSLKIDSIKKIVFNQLVGKYYVENFREYLERGFVLKKDKPKYNYGVYSFNFTENREIKFEDLTEVYECGNGILALNSGKWKINENGNIELYISGEYTMIKKFNTSSEYKLSELTNGNKKMELVKILYK